MRRLFLLVVLGLTIWAGSIGAQGNPGSVIVAEGFAAPNTYAGPLPSFFDTWCHATEDGTPCIPTIAIPVTDVRKGNHLGTIYAWGKDFKNVSGTLQFKEFVLFDLKGGQLFTLSQDGGHPGGAFADPTLIPPKQGDVVLIGGAEGVVVGGTGKYSSARGPYSTRLKVETIGGFFAYYDELYFRFRQVEVQ